MKLSFIIPAYNEAKTVAETVRKVWDADIGPHEKEIILVDDGSTDNTNEVLQNLRKPLTVLRHNRNFGKGRAIRTGLAHASGDYVIIQDADLEYDPAVCGKLLQKITQSTPVIYGRRSYRQGYLHYRLGAYLLTAVINLAFGSKLHDSYTCYKLVPTSLLRSLNLHSDGFEIEAEITAKLLKKRIPILEIPINYQPRKFSAGKKIRGRDALKGLIKILEIRRGS